MTMGGRSGKGRLENLLAPGFDGNAIPKPMGELKAHPLNDLPGVGQAVAKRWTGEKPEKLDAAGHFERATRHPRFCHETGCHIDRCKCDPGVVAKCATRARAVSGYSWP